MEQPTPEVAEPPEHQDHAEEPDHPDRPGPPTHDPHHRATLFVLFVAFIVLAGSLTAVGAYYGHCGGADGTHAPVTVTVPSGASASQVVDQLAAKDVIRCGGIVGRLMLEKTGNGGSIRAGTFHLTTGMTLDRAMAVLTSPAPAVPTAELTIPPGYRITQIGSLVQHELGIPATRFDARALSGGYSLRPYLPAHRGTEGFLFPDTYQFTRNGASADDVIRRLLDRFDVVAKTLPFANAKRLGTSPYEIVVIASMIEKEARVEADRPLVAAVIYNRLAAGMTLGVDATVAYIDPNPANGLTSSDFRIDSPYNTRLHVGLPPTPIASPGGASLAAALAPAHTDDLYYLQCPGRARLLFSSTYRTFLREKAACLG